MGLHQLARLPPAQLCGQLPGRWAMGRIRGHGPSHNRAQVGGNVGGKGLRSLARHLGDDQHRIGPGERGLARQHGVQERTKGAHIRARVGGLETCSELDLPLEARQQLWTLAQQLLDGDRTPQPLVDCGQDSPHAPSSHLLSDQVGRRRRRLQGDLAVGGLRRRW